MSSLVNRCRGGQGSVVVRHAVTILCSPQIVFVTDCSCFFFSLFVSASGSEAASGEESGSVLQRLAAQRQPDRQEPSGLPGADVAAIITHSVFIFNQRKYDLKFTQL